jgi:RNA polymerase sigma-70 factor (ECF subfamily)
MAHISVEPLAAYSIANSCAPVSYPVIEERRYVVRDEELVERSLKGEEDAFRHLYERYRRPVYAAVCRIIPDPEEARDATQEAFIAAYRSLALWSPGRARFLPWIRKVATNRAIDHWRMWRRRAELQLTATSETQQKSAPDFRVAARPVERTLECLERAAEVRRILEGLPYTQRRFVILRYCEGLKLREIAEKEGYKLGTVKSTLHRATRALRCRLRRL